MSSLRIGVNLGYLVEDSGGSGTYARELLPRLIAAQPGVELTAWIGTTAPHWLTRQPWSGDVRWIRLPVRGVGSPWHFWHELVGIGLDARRRRLDVVHGLSNIGPLVHPGVPTVTTILDVIWVHHPDAGGKRFRTVMRTLTPRVGRASDRLIAISEAARDDIATTLRFDPGKFDVTPLGVVVPPEPTTQPDRTALAARLGLGPEPITLCVAAKRAHKNLDGLIRAHALLPEPRPQLVLPGSPNEYEEQLRALAHDLGVKDSVRFPGWLDDADLERLYRLSSCFVLPTLQEGFGLPVLEAMARGLPVACSDIPVLREVAGDAALLFDPLDPASMGQAISRLILDTNLAATLRERGRARCRRFTWEQTARLTLASYGRAREQRVGPRQIAQA
jgi:glycosyltransferase involved in cell wall biosynthesis